jgi:hypothetical protein
MSNSKPFIASWGIIGTGWIASEFAKDISLVRSSLPPPFSAAYRKDGKEAEEETEVLHEVVAVGSRSEEKAAEFIKVGNMITRIHRRSLDHAETPLDRSFDHFLFLDTDNSHPTCRITRNSCRTERQPKSPAWCKPNQSPSVHTPPSSPVPYESFSFLPSLLPTHASYSRMQDVQIIYIATPHTSHYSLARLALEAGKHVLVEKPATLVADEWKALMALAKEKNVFLMEGASDALC